MTCPICQHEGHDDQLDLCIRARKVVSSANRAGKNSQVIQAMLEVVVAAKAFKQRYDACGFAGAQGPLGERLDKALTDLGVQ